MEKYVAYYRVSTKYQGDSGLGLLAQRELVSRHVKNDDLILKEYEEVESGKNNDRPQLKRAIECCKKEGAKLVIAKLDRLSRNASFILMLRNSNVDFVCADVPEANTLTIGVLAVLAEEEGRRISERTVSALSEIKRKIRNGEEHISKSGNVVKSLGNPQNLKQSHRKKGSEVLSKKAINNENNKRAGAFILSLKKQGLNMYNITKELNKAGFLTSRGNQFSQIQTKRLYERYNNKGQ